MPSIRGSAVAKQRSEVTELVRKVQTEGTGYNYSSLTGFLCPLDEGHILGGQDTVGSVLHGVLEQKYGVARRASDNTVRHQWNMGDHYSAFLESTLFTRGKKGRPGGNRSKG